VSVLDRARETLVTWVPARIETRHLLLIGIIATAVFTRFWRLGTPGGFYFDEVYDAFTAREILHGNGAAWEFRAAAPQGFAFEWVEPALHELLMAGGMLFFGDTSAIGWRFFGALFGVGSIVFVYLLGKRLFKSEVVALSAAFLMTFESLGFVQSRLATNDIYLLFFSLGSLYFLVSDRYLLSGLFLGAALATKWSVLLIAFPFAVYFTYQFLQTERGPLGEVTRDLVRGLVSLGVGAGVTLLTAGTNFFGWIRASASDFPGSPLPFWVVMVAMAVGVIELVRAIAGVAQDRARRETERGRFVMEAPLAIPLFFIVVPASVYLLSYLPFFFTGHSLHYFWELHRQMWLYQTETAGTQSHPYQSLWYEWPIMARPIYYYLSPAGGQIYAVGNPVIFWAGLPAMAGVLWQLVRRVKIKVDSGSGEFNIAAHLQKADFALLFILVAYLGFFASWAFSPRILFIYHYLPSLPFLALGLGYWVQQLWEAKREWRLGARSCAFLRGLVHFVFGEWLVRVLFGERTYISIHPRIFAIAFLAMAALTFVYFYPHLAAVSVSGAWEESYFWLPNSIIRLVDGVIPIPELPDSFFWFDRWR